MHFDIHDLINKFGHSGCWLSLMCNFPRVIPWNFFLEKNTIPCFQSLEPCLLFLLHFCIPNFLTSISMHYIVNYLSTSCKWQYLQSKCLLIWLLHSILLICLCLDVLQVDLTEYMEKHEFVFDAVLNEEVSNDEVIIASIKFTWFWGELMVFPITCSSINYVSYFISLGISWNCWAYSSYNFPTNKGHLLCLWPNR